MYHIYIYINIYTHIYQHIHTIYIYTYKHIYNIYTYTHTHTNAFQASFLNDFVVLGYLPKLKGGIALVFSIHFLCTFSIKMFLTKYSIN